MASNRMVKWLWSRIRPTSAASSSSNDTSQRDAGTRREEFRSAIRPGALIWRRSGHGHRERPPEPSRSPRRVGQPANAPHLRPTRTRTSIYEMPSFTKTRLSLHIKITPGQRDAIIKMPYPLNSEGEVDETRLRSFIGLANFSRRYINNFAMHAYLLNGLLRKEPTGIWTLAHAIAYDAISSKV